MRAPGSSPPVPAARARSDGASAEGTLPLLPRDWPGPSPAPRVGLRSSAGGHSLRTAPRRARPQSPPSLWCEVREGTCCSVFARNRVCCEQNLAEPRPRPVWPPPGHFPSLSSSGAGGALGRRAECGGDEHDIMPSGREGVRTRSNGDARARGPLNSPRPEAAFPPSLPTFPGIPSAGHSEHQQEGPAVWAQAWCARTG